MPRGREPASVPGPVEAPRYPLLSAPELQFLLDAVTYYCATHCPLDHDEGWCPLLSWRESVHSGAIERACVAPYETWRTRLATLAAAG